jgi:phospholipid/cholesterol/gamma-HCH transport system permease protein
MGWLAARIIRKFGGEISDALVRAGYALCLLIEASFHLATSFYRPRVVREIVNQMYFCGVKALGVTSVVALFTGMIVALQTGIEAEKYGHPEAIGMVVSAGMCREMGPFITAIILTAMVGSAIAAELSTMKVSEEIDALEVMAINPVKMLAMPRIAALTLMCFALTILVDVVGILGGGLVAQARLGVPFHRYIDFAQLPLEGRDLFGLLPKDVYSGLFKAWVFGTVIATVACAQGFLARGGALGVGRAVRRTVVSSIILILVLGYFMTSFFYRT